MMDVSVSFLSGEPNVSPRHSYDVHLGVEPHPLPPAAERPRTTTSVLLLGDFSGRGGVGATSPVLVDRDVIDGVMARIAPSVELDDGTVLSFESIDELHPDEFKDRVPRVGAILDGRPLPTPSEVSKAGDAPPAPPPSDAGLLDQIVGGSSAPTADVPKRRPADPLRAFAAEASARDVVPARSAAAEAEERSTSQRAAAALGDVLRLPAFRALERRWRGVDFLTRRLDTGPGLHLYMADLSRNALRAEIDAPEGLQASALHCILSTGAGAEQEPWSFVVVMDGTFGPDPDDQLLLAWIAGLCAASGAVVIVDGEPSLAGIASLDDFDDRQSWSDPDPGWQAFRTQPEARSIAVCLPGFLLRDPYGRDTAPVEGLPLEEAPGRPASEDYVWGGAALACAVVLARESRSESRGGVPDTSISNLPLHSWRDGVDSGTRCGEAAMTDEAARRLGATGITPLAWMRASDSVRLLLPRSAAGESLLG